MSQSPTRFVLAFGALIAMPVAALGQDYVVQPGDTLMGIAGSELGSPARWRVICELNADVLNNCDRILSGTVLRLSPAEEASPEAAVEVEPIAESAAPAAETIADQETADISRLPEIAIAGAVPGVLGEGGRLPRGWRVRYFAGAEGVSEVTAVTADYIDLRITQRTAGTSAVQFIPPDGAYFSAGPGEDWQLALELAVIEGVSGSDVTMQLRGTERGESGSSIRAISFVSPVELTPDLRRHAGTSTIQSADAEFINPDFRIRSTGSWEATFRIGLPEFGILPR